MVGFLDVVYRATLAPAPRGVQPRLSPLPTSTLCTTSVQATPQPSPSPPGFTLTLSTPDPKHPSVSFLFSKPHLRCHFLQEAFLIARV